MNCFYFTKDRTSLHEMSWELLHWIFTNPLKISVVKESEVSEYLTDLVREETKLMTIPNPDEYCKRFKITHPIETNSTSESCPFSHNRSSIHSIFQICRDIP